MKKNNRSTKILATVLALAMLLPTFAVFDFGTLKAQAASITYIDPPATGSIAISNRAQLSAIRNNPLLKYHLTNDIDLAGSAWDPIPTFSGMLDGQGHVIKGLFMDIVPSGSTDGHAGLIAEISGSSVEIKNLGIEIDPRGITLSKPINPTPPFPFLLYYPGRLRAGGIVGRCHSGSQVTIQNCFVRGGKIHSYNSSNTIQAGGFIGSAEATATRINITNSYSMVEVEVSNSSDNDYSASFIGRNELNEATINISNSYAIGNIKAERNVGYFVTSDHSRITITNSYRASSQTLSGNSKYNTSMPTFTPNNLPSTFSPSVWALYSGENSNYPVLRVFYHVDNVSLNKTATTIMRGYTETLTLNVFPSNAINKNATWSSSDSNIATVDQNGVVTAKESDGRTAIITATVEDNGKTFSASCVVTTAKPPTTGITLSESYMPILAGKTISLTETIEPSDARNKNVTWISSAPSVADVDENGNVSAKSAGVATITVTTVDGGFKAFCTISVDDYNIVAPIDKDVTL